MNFFFVLYNTGLRIGEVCALEWHDVDMEKKCIYINKTINRVEKYYDSKSRKMEEPKMVTEITSPKKKASYRAVPITEDIVHAFYTGKEKQVMLV